MEKLISNLSEQFAMLGHPGRLALFGLLMRRYPEAVPAGEIAAVLNLKANTTSNYLSALKSAQLIESERRGTSLLYRIDMQGAQAMTRGLFLDCCQARPDLCLPGCDDAGDMCVTAQRAGVLFVCSGNSARSIMAEAILRDIAGDKFACYSASRHPSAQPNPEVLEVLRDKGHDISGLRSKSLERFQTSEGPQLDLVLTLCDRAANAPCPRWRDQPVTSHWSLPDPIPTEDRNTRMAMFEDIYETLKLRLSTLAKLPFGTMNKFQRQDSIDQMALHTTAP